MIKVRLIAGSFIAIISSLFLPINYFVTTNVSASFTTAPLPPPSNLEEDDDDVKSLYSKGLEAIEQQMYEEAIGYVEAVLAIDPDNVTALNNTGYSLSYLERYEEAIGSFDNALALESATTAATATTALAEDITQTSINREGHQVILIRNSNVDDDSAQLHYITLFLTSKTAIDAQYNKGIAFFQEGRYQEAVETFDSILANDESHIDSLYDTAQCYEKLGDIEQANQYMNMVCQIDPTIKEEEKDSYKKLLPLP